MKSAKERRETIESLNRESPIADLEFLIKECFHAHFGSTTDEERLADIAGEQNELQRAASHTDRIGELGDLLSSCIKMAGEQGTDLVTVVKRSLLKIEGRADVYARYGNKKKVAICGITGDPPTLGHLKTATEVLDALGGEVHEAWIMPPYEYRGAKRPADVQHRAAMCRLLEQSDPRLKFFGYEIDHELSGETVLTMKRVLDEPFANMHKFFLVQGLDAANKVPTWHRSQELRNLVEFIVVPRVGYDAAPDAWFRQKPHRFLQNVSVPDISSSRVKKLYGKSDRDPSALDEAATLVTPAIHNYILEHGLYGAKPA